VKYGERYHVLNGYAGGTYLDTCGHANCSGTTKYNVTTSSMKDRDGVGTGFWSLESAAGKAPGAVLAIGDTVHLRNMYAAGSYLDTCGHARCTSQTMYGVCTDSGRDRAQGTGQWVVESATGAAPGTPVSIGDRIHLKNRYGSGSYLDTCGHGQCTSSTKYEVVTNGRADREGQGTGVWSFVK
jgi:hypothetical protein